MCSSFSSSTDWFGRISWVLLDIEGPCHRLHDQRATGDGKREKMLPVYPNRERPAFRQPAKRCANIISGTLYASLDPERALHEPRNVQRYMRTAHAAAARRAS